METNYAIEMLNITKRFPGIIANDNITLRLKKGEIHALLGENGAGKSTLMSVLFGLYQPEEGEIHKDGRKVEIRDPNDANALGIGMVHQHFKLVECFSVLDNIILGVEPNQMGFLQKQDARKKVLDLSEKYGLHVDPDAIIEDITVGMQQRTEILKMLYRDNEILIFDEPTAVLTPQEIEELMQIMKNLAAEGKSILFISHKLNEIMEVSDRVTVLRKGKCIGTVETANTTAEELSAMMVGRNVSFHVEKGPLKPGGEVLSVEHLTVASKVHKNNAVKDVSFRVRAGEIVCIAGIDGNGQTELVYALTGLEPAVSGKITLEGKDITHASIRQRSLMGMSHIPEDRHKHGLVLDYTLEDNMVLQRYFEPEFTDKAGFLRRKNIRAYAEGLIEQYDVRAGQGPVTHGAQHVRRQPAEGHRCPRDRQASRAARRRAAHARSGRRRDRVHPQAACRPARRGQGRAARLAGAGRGHGRAGPHSRHVRGRDRRRAGSQVHHAGGAWPLHGGRQER